jgi:hypothetical protein
VIKPPDAYAAVESPYIVKNERHPAMMEDLKNELNFEYIK